MIPAVSISATQGRWVYCLCSIDATVLPPFSKLFGPSIPKIPSQPLDRLYSKPGHVQPIRFEDPNLSVHDERNITWNSTEAFSKRWTRACNPLFFSFLQIVSQSRCSSPTHPLSLTKTSTRMGLGFEATAQQEYAC